MALKKEIELDNGIIIDYHRISSINTIINKEIQIVIFSYVNNEKRVQEEIGEAYNVISSKMITKEYEEDFDVVKAYEYIKGLEEFADAEDVFEPEIEETIEEEIIEEPVEEFTDVIEEVVEESPDIVEGGDQE